MNEQSPTSAGADALRRIMSEGKVSQRELSRRSGIDQGAISRFLSGTAKTMHLETWQAIAEALERPLRDFGVDMRDVSTAGVQTAKVRDLVPSTLNPRHREHDPDALAQLQASIAAHGVLQPLTVRHLKTVSPHHGDQFVLHEVVIGGRRLAACKALVEAGTWSNDAEVPVIITKADDDVVLQMAIIENVQRETMHWLDEGDALLKLTDDGMETAVIAQQIGKTPRWVQERVRVARNLEPQARHAATTDQLNFQQAKEMARAPQSVQSKVMDIVAKDERDHPDASPAPIRDYAIREAIINPTIPIDRAIFPLEQYDGEFFGDPGDDDRRFVDVKLFKKLQRKAIAELEKGFRRRIKDGEIEFFERIDDYGFRPGDQWGGQGSKFLPSNRAAHGMKPVGKAGVVLHVTDRLDVAIHDPIWRAKKDSGGTATESPDGGPKPYDPIENATMSGRRSYGRRAKTRVLQDAVAQDPDMAMRLACYALLRPHSAFSLIRLEGPYKDFFAIGGYAQGRLEAFAKDAQVDFVRLDPDDDLPADRYEKPAPSELADRYGFVPGADKAWLAIEDMSKPDLATLFAALVASTISTQAHADGEVGAIADTPLSVRLANELKITMSKAWQIDEAYLATLRKPDLAVLADRIGFGRHALPAKVTDQRKEILAYVIERKVDHVPPEMRFDTGKVMKRELERLPTPQAAKSEKD